MRFALIATSVAAVIAIPLATSEAAPQMSSDDFVTAVRCTAYEDLARPGSDVVAAKFRLNGEAARQPAETVAEAHKAASDIARAIATSEKNAGLARACRGMSAADRT